MAFSEDAVQVTEGSRRALTLRRSGPAQQGAGAVTVTSLPVSATSGSDFTPVSKVVEFAADERQKTLEVEALADGEQEPDETFLVAIGSPTGDAATGAPSSVAVTIPAPATSGPGDGGPGAGGPGAAGTAPAFGAKTRVTLGLASRRIPGNGPVRVRIANANGFAVSGELSAQTAGKRPVSRERRLQLGTKPFTVDAHAKTTIGLGLPKALRRLLKRRHRLSLRLAAKVKDPAGHSRSVTKAVERILRNRRTS